MPLGLSTSVAPVSGVGSGEVRLSWAAPASDGGSPVTDYVIERSTNGTTWVTIVDGVSTSTSYLAVGLSNGTAYQFRVSARNAVGDGPATAPVTATPRAVPGAPLGLSAVVAPASGVGSGEVRLSWAAPASDGGSPVTDYVIERSTNGFTWVTVVDGVSTATSHTVSGLSNGTAYQFRVTAHNAVGDGQPSAEVSATPRTLPSVPLALSAAVAPVSGVGSGEVRLSWAAPASDGGSPVTDYVIEQSTNGTTWVTVVDGVSTTSNFKVTGLTNGTAYQFRVSARNAVGDGPSSVADVGDAAHGAGGAVGVGRRRWLRCLGSVRVRFACRWAAPSSDGGSPVTDYVIEQSTNGTTWVTVVDGVSTATSHTVSGLTNGTGYQFRVSARNAVGDGSSSVAVSATPRTVPAAPQTISGAVAPVSGVGSGEVRLTWTGPASDGGSPVTDYVIEQSTNGTTWVTVVDGVSTATSFTVSGLSNGTAYQFRVSCPQRRW